MNTANHVVLLSHVLAPAAPTPHPVSAMKYATETWTPGGLVLLAVIILLAVGVVKGLAKLGNSRQQ